MSDPSENRNLPESAESGEELAESSGVLRRAREWGEAAWREGREQGAGVSRTTHVLFALCALFCLVFLVWASIFELDIVSATMGEVTPRSKVKRVQHLEGGIVSEILVREGDLVTTGQPLVVLEETASESSVGELQLRVRGLQIEIARLEAEEQGLEAPVFEPELMENAAEQVEEALALFHSRINRHKNELATLEESILQRQQDIVEIESRLANLRRNLPLVRKQVARDKDLFAEKLIREDQLIGHQKELNNLISEIAENSAALERAHSMVANAETTLEKAGNEYVEEVRTQLRKSRQELLELTQRLRKYADIEQRTVIRSPVEGVVNTLYLVNEGEVVRPGVTILDIVPADDPLIIEARLPVRDIGYVAVGQRAVVKLPTADARRFGSLEGQVVHISPDTVTLETGETFYRVRVETDKDHFERDGHQHRLFPGMQVICAIHTGTRTVLEYLAYPYFNALTEGLQER